MGRTKKILSKRGSVRRIILIFVTVGTHEQGIDRLLIGLDRLLETNEINQKVFAQIGYSKYIPKNYGYKTMMGYDEMDDYVRNSDIIITHGGPGSIFHPLQYGKIPVVVPRNPEFNEHVDNHQILFTKRLEKDNKVIAVYDINELKTIINKYEELALRCQVDNSSTKDFVINFDKLIRTRLNII